MDRLRVGILGLGRGSGHLRNFLAVEEAEVIGAADRIAARREAAAERIAPATVPMVAEYEQLLEMRPDAVVVATNGRLQARHAVQAMEAGCHVLSEVPGAFTEQEVHTVVATARRTGMRYMLAENSCFWDFARYWRKWVIEGRLGSVSVAEGEYLHYLPHSLMDSDGARHNPSQVRGQLTTDALPSWRADQPPIQYLTHDLGPLLEVLDDRVVSVSCTEGPYWQDESPLRPDSMIATFKSAAGRLVKLQVALGTRQPNTHNYRLLGTRGSLEWFRHENFGRRLFADRDYREGWERVDIRMAPPGKEGGGHGGADIQIARHFTRAMLGGGGLPIDVFRMADYTLPGIIAARSARLGGQPLAIPDLRDGPFRGTRLWDFVELPDEEPAVMPYRESFLPWS